AGKAREALAQLEVILAEGDLATRQSWKKMKITLLESLKEFGQLDAYIQVLWNEGLRLPEMYLAEAEVRCSRKNWGAAATSCEEGLKEHPDNLRLKAKLMSLLYKCERAEDADALRKELSIAAVTSPQVC